MQLTACKIIVFPLITSIKSHLFLHYGSFFFVFSHLQSLPYFNLYIHRLNDVLSSGSERGIIMRFAKGRILQDKRPLIIKQKAVFHNAKDGLLKYGMRKAYSPAACNRPKIRSTLAFVARATSSSLTP